MLKKSLSALLVIFIMFSLMSAVTAAKDSDFVINNGVLVRYNGSGGNVVVPDGVTGIGESAFASIVSVTSVKLPDSVTIIGDYAFDSCRSLSYVFISEGVKTVGFGAFAGCRSLSEINVDKNNPYYTSISGVMFDKNQSVLMVYSAGSKNSSYSIPAGVKTIGSYAFSDSGNLTSIAIPDSVTKIEENAFDSCGKLASVTIPNSVVIIKNNAFTASGLTSVKLPYSITEIADYMFSHCKSLSAITIPESVTRIGNAAFQLSGLISITIPNSVTDIGWEAFNSNPSLESIIIPESVTSIGGGAFYASDNVTIYGIKDSYAHKYAKDNYVKFAEYTVQDGGRIELDTSSVTQSKPAPVNTKFEPSEILNKLGLFNGIGTDSQGNPIFDLERAPTRQEALVMLVRLLGLEKAALSSSVKHPFDDVASWAVPYVGYAYSMGLTNGISPDKFGSNELVTLQQYSVFLLRALGYSEKNNDFTYSNALDKAYELGIIKSKEGELFTRGSAAELSYNILLLSPKGKTEKLANKLLWDDVFTTDQLDKTRDGKLMLAADMPDLITDGVIVYNLEDLRGLIYLSMKNNQSGLGINVPGYSGEQLRAVYDDIIKDYPDKAILYPTVICRANYIYPEIRTGDYLMMEYYYADPARYQKSYKFYRTDLIEYSGVTVTLAGWVKKIDGIIKENTKSSMSETEKVKALHDYLVLNTAYDRAAEGKLTKSHHFARQIIFEGYGVCDGYSEAFKILMNAAGIECKVIYGDTPYGLHAWNQVKIDGVWYNMDVTWNDPDNGDKILYDYFCVSDEKFYKDHEADEICKPEKCPYTLKLN